MKAKIMTIIQSALLKQIVLPAFHHRPLEVKLKHAVNFT